MQVQSGNFTSIDLADSFAALYVWLRYSATRHLTWQRHYNTQPRILAGAQDNLTRAITAAHGKLSGEPQEWVRLMLGTVGRGGDGQKIRDEILNIMHRNKIPEKKVGSDFPCVSRWAATKGFGYRTSSNAVVSGVDVIFCCDCFPRTLVYTYINQAK